MVKRLQSVFAAAGTVDNQAAGQSIEFCSEDSTLTIAAATTAANATMNVRLTDEIVMDDSIVPVAAAPAPVLPDQMLLKQQPMLRGDHLIIKVVASAAMTVTTLVEIQPA